MCTTPLKNLQEEAEEADTQAKDHQEEKDVVTSLREEIKTLQEQARVYQQAVDELKVEASKVTDVQSAAQTQLAEANARIAALQQQSEEHKAREAQVRAHNKVCLMLYIIGGRLIYVLRPFVRNCGRSSRLPLCWSDSGTLVWDTGLPSQTERLKRVRRRPQLLTLQGAPHPGLHHHQRLYLTKRSTSSICGTLFCSSSSTRK